MLKPLGCRFPGGSRKSLLVSQEKRDARSRTEEVRSAFLPSNDDPSGGSPRPTSSALFEPASEDVPSASAILADIVDADILPQLRSIHRGGEAISRGVEVCSAEAERLARLLLADRDGFRDMIAGHVARGSPWPVVASEILLPAARGLGCLWMDDVCDFLEVTEAMGGLQAATQGVLPPAPHRTKGPDPRSILLAPAPGEMHGYGLSLAAGFFRDDGWTVMTLCRPHAQMIGSLVSSLQSDWYDVLGLSLACDIHVPAVRRAVPLFRRASRNPDLRVIVGGALIARGGADAAGLGVDACLADACRAPGAASELLHSFMARPDS